MNILPHIFGTLALGTWVSSVQVKKKSNILILQFLANIFYAIQYFLLGLFSTGIMNLVSVFRCFAFSLNARKNKENPLWLLILLLLVILIFALIYCRTLLSIIPILATFLYTISTWQNDTKYLVYIFILCAVLFLLYNYLVGAYISLIGNLFEILSGVISIIRIEKQKRS